MPFDPQHSHRFPSLIFHPAWRTWWCHRHACALQRQRRIRMKRKFINTVRAVARMAMLRNRTRRLRQVHPARTGYHGNKLILSVSGICTNRFIPRNSLCTYGFSLVSGCCCCCFLLFFFLSAVCKFFAFCDFVLGTGLHVPLFPTLFWTYLEL